ATAAPGTSSRASLRVRPWLVTLTPLSALRSTSSRHVDLYHAIHHARGKHTDRQILGHPTLAGGEVEIEPVPRAHHRVALDPAVCERPILVWAQRAHRVEAPIATVEDGERARPGLHETAAAGRDVGAARHTHERHQRGARSASSIASRNVST